MTGTKFLFPLHGEKERAARTAPGIDLWGVIR
jgi:hypothetical protein